MTAIAAMFVSQMVFKVCFEFIRQMAPTFMVEKLGSLRA